MVKIRQWRAKRMYGGVEDIAEKRTNSMTHCGNEPEDGETEVRA